MPRRDGSIDVAEGYIRFEKVPYFRAFRAFDRQRQRADLTIKTFCQNISIALVGGLSRPFRCQRVELVIWMFL